MTYNENNVHGVDVAYPYQGDAYDTKGMGFVFVKATQGNHYTNPHQAQQLNQGSKHGLALGVYLFTEGGISPKSQAQYFHENAIVAPGTMIAVDWEGYEGRWSTDADKTALIKLLKEMYPKHRVGLYTNRDGWEHHDTDSYCGDFLWIAVPGKPGVVGIKHDWTFHQYAVKSNVDQDTSRFTSVNSLKQWAGVPNMTAKDYHDQAGFPVWAYKNPMGDGELDTYAKLTETYETVQSLMVKVVKLSADVAALTKLVQGQVKK